MRRNARKSIGKLNITEIVMCSKLSVMSSVTQIPLKYLFNKINGKVIDVSIDTNEHVVLKEWEYRVTERYLIKTEIIMDTVIIIRTTRATYVFDNG